MMRILAGPLTAVLFLCAALGASAASETQASTTFSIPAVYVATPPKLDGTLNDPLWKTGSHATLGWDLTLQRAAAESTDVYVLADARNLYVAFVARQTEPVIATQRNNDVPLGNDDVVRVYLWPQDDAGFSYTFVSNPIGTRVAFSSENSAFAPVWTTVATMANDGYTVTERIPLDVLRGTSRSTWRLQFDRRVRQTGQYFEWANSPQQTSTSSSTYAGYLTGMKVASAASRPKPRVQLYGLGQSGSMAAGGTRSRFGTDFAIPVTPTASFVGTVNPDYSNVELDQQSIAPTAFPRRSSEVRPFFTQGGQFFNPFNCNDCVDYPLLYTPFIPTPKDGFALEGTQGRFQFAGFDSISPGRSDTAQVVTYRTPNRRIAVEYQRQSVSGVVSGYGPTPIFDVAQFAQVSVGNVHNFSVYGTVGGDRGSLVSNGREGRYSEYGINFFTAKSGLFAAYHDVGSQYNPVDSFVQQNDLHGPSLNAYKQWDYSPQNFIQSINIGQDIQYYKDHTGTLASANDATNLTVSARNLFSVSLSTGSQYLALPDPSSPSGYDAGNTNQNGISLDYGAQTSTPQDFTYNAGRFGAGFLRSTQAAATFKVRRRGTLSFLFYGTDFSLDSGSTVKQWLQRASFAYPLGPDSSFAVGVRKISGTGPTFFGTPLCITPSCSATNISFAYHRRSGPGELYLVYGSPNALVTRPLVIIKYIFYAGAAKGT